MKLMSRFLCSTIHQVMWYFWVYIVNPFSLLWSIFFPRKLYFLWCPCLLLIAKSVSLNTFGKSTVRFFFKIASTYWIIFSFCCFKWILIWQKILEAFWGIYLNIIFSMLLWMLTPLVIWHVNITVSSTLKYCYK